MATQVAAQVNANTRRQTTELPIIYSRAVRNEPGEPERKVRDETYQQCGGGRRIFRKKLTNY